MTLTFLLSSLVRALRRHAPHRHRVAGRDGGRRHVRPGGRRLPPLLGRRLLAGAALREDALRPGAAAAPTCTDGRSPARRVTGVAEEIVTYVLRDLRHPEGGFFSAEDADSEGIEGKFYCWSVDELREVCGDDADEVMRFYGVTEQGNFEDPHGIPWQHPPRRAPRRGAAAGRRRALPRLLEARPPGAARARRQGPPRLLFLGWRRPRSCSIATTGWPRRAGAEFLVTRLRVRRSPAAILAGRPRAPARVRRGPRGAARGAAHAGRGRRRRLARPGARSRAI